MGRQWSKPFPDGLLGLEGIDAPVERRGERIRLVRPPRLPETEWVVVVRSAHQWRVFHEDYELCVFPAEANTADAGAGYTYRRWEVACRPGAVYLFEPDTLHANRELYGPATFYVIKIAPAHVETLAAELGIGAKPHFRVASTDAPRLQSAVAALTRAVVSSASRLEQETLLGEVVQVALAEAGDRRLHPRSGTEARAVRQIRDYLHANVGGAVSLADLQAITGLSRYHLVRSFTHSYGLAPHAYLNVLRAAEARHLLAAGTQPSRIDVGFFDQAHLTRHFKRAYAVTPAAYLLATAILS